MDKTLAEIYGTNQSDDQEKLAAAAAAEELTEDGALDLEGMTEEDLEAVAAEVLEASSDEEETEEPAEEAEKTAEENDEELEEKVAEADQMGRIMAHAYVQELREIEKTAGAKEVGKAIGRVAKKVHTKAQKLGKKIINVGNKGRSDALKTKLQTKADLKASSKFNPSSKEHTVEKHKEMFKAISDAKKGAKKTHGRVLAATGYGAAGTAAAGAGYAGKKAFGKDKKASALDTLAEQRANEILEQYGVTEEPQAEEATKYDVLADAVEQRAVELLVENGYEFSQADESAEE